MKSGALSSPRSWTSVQSSSSQPKVAGHRLESDRLAGHLPDVIDHVEKIGNVPDFPVPVGRDGVLTFRDAANGGNFGGDLRSGQYSSLARLCPLAQLQFEHPDIFVGGDLAQPVVAEIAILIAHAVLCRSDLEDDVASAFQVMWTTIRPRRY